MTMHNDDGPRLSDTLEAKREERELEVLVEVLGAPEAQRAAENHILTELVSAAQHR